MPAWPVKFVVFDAALAHAQQLPGPRLIRVACMPAAARNGLPGNYQVYAERVDCDITGMTTVRRQDFINLRLCLDNVIFLDGMLDFLLFLSALFDWIVKPF